MALGTYAKALRHGMTDAERTLWKHLRDRRMGGFKFRRQVPLNSFIVDFVCFDARLVIEVDGGHHGERADEDSARTGQLAAKGYRLLRFWNHEVLGETDAVLEAIRKALSCA